MEFNVWHKGVKVDKIKADTLRKASSMAKKIYNVPVVLASVDATPEQEAQAKHDSMVGSIPKGQVEAPE